MSTPKAEGFDVAAVNTLDVVRDPFDSTKPPHASW